MATLWIREYVASAAVGASGMISAPVPQEPGTDQSPLTISATSAQSAATGPTTRYVTISADAAFHFVVAADPTATTGARRVPADTEVSFGIAAGMKIAARTAA